MTPRHDPADGAGRALARAGFLASLLAVFLCGWFAMRTEDWRRTLLLSILALVAGTVASQFARRVR